MNIATLIAYELNMSVRIVLHYCLVAAVLTSMIELKADIDKITTVYSLGHAFHYVRSRLSSRIP